MPPIANQGAGPASDAAYLTRPSPGAGRPGLVGVGQTGPAQK